MAEFKDCNLILWLDDDQNRSAIAYQRMTPEERNRVIWCMTAEEAIITLKDYKNQLTFVSLDHDLGGQTFVHPAREDCGMEIVRWLEKLHKKEPEEFEPFKKIEFVVHSWNTISGPKMVIRLQAIGLKAKYHPFGS